MGQSHFSETISIKIVYYFYEKYTLNHYTLGVGNPTLHMEALDGGSINLACCSLKLLKFISHDTSTFFRGSSNSYAYILSQCFSQKTKTKLSHFQLHQTLD